MFSSCREGRFAHRLFEALDSNDKISSYSNTADDENTITIILVFVLQYLLILLTLFMNKKAK